jgi:acetyl-CoA acetyltransferase
VLVSQSRAAAGPKAGRFDAEIVPMTVTKLTQDKNTGEVREEQVTQAQDEGNRPDTSLDGLVAPVRGDKGAALARAPTKRSRCRHRRRDGGDFAVPSSLSC